MDKFFLKSWTSTGYSSNSMGSSAIISGKLLSPFIAPLHILMSAHDSTWIALIRSGWLYSWITFAIEFLKLCKNKIKIKINFFVYG